MIRSISSGARCCSSSAKPGSTRNFSAPSRPSDSGQHAAAKPTPATAFAKARRDWSGFRGRGEHGLGPWTPLGPTNGVNDLDNVYRDRTVYNAGTQNFGGRTVDAVISPDCRPAHALPIAACTG